MGERTSRSGPRRRLWAAAVVALAAYPASFLPACWILVRAEGAADEGGSRVIRAAFRPAALALMACPDGVRRSADRVVNVAAADGVVFRAEPTGVAVWRREVVGGREGMVLHPIW